MGPAPGSTWRKAWQEKSGCGRCAKTRDPASSAGATRPRTKTTSDFAGPRDPASGATPLNLYRFADGKTVEVGHIDKPLRLHLSVSPDEKWLAWAQLDNSVDDLMLVENFR